MIGLDTTFLVQGEIQETDGHDAVLTVLRQASPTALAAGSLGDVFRRLRERRDS